MLVYTYVYIQLLVVLVMSFWEKCVLARIQPQCFCPFLCWFFRRGCLLISKEWFAIACSGWFAQCSNFIKSCEAWSRCSRIFPSANCWTWCWPPGGSAQVTGNPGAPCRLRNKNQLSKQRRWPLGSSGPLMVDTQALLRCQRGIWVDLAESWPWFSRRLPHWLMEMGDGP